MNCKNLSSNVVAHFVAVRERFDDMVPNVNQYIFDNADLDPDLEDRLDTVFYSSETNNGLADRLLQSVLGLSYEDVVRESEIMEQPLPDCFEDLARCSDEIPDEEQSLLAFYRAYTNKSNTPDEIALADAFFVQLVGVSANDMLCRIGASIEKRLEKESALRQHRAMLLAENAPECGMG